MSEYWPSSLDHKTASAEVRRDLRHRLARIGATKKIYEEIDWSDESSYTDTRDQALELLATQISEAEAEEDTGRIIRLNLEKFSLDYDHQIFKLNFDVLEAKKNLVSSMVMLAMTHLAEIIDIQYPDPTHAAMSYRQKQLLGASSELLAFIGLNLNEDHTAITSQPFEGFRATGASNNYDGTLLSGDFRQNVEIKSGFRAIERPNQNLVMYGVSGILTNGLEKYAKNILISPSRELIVTDGTLPIMSCVDSEIPIGTRTASPIEIIILLAGVKYVVPSADIGLNDAQLEIVNEVGDAVWNTFIDHLTMDDQSRSIKWAEYRVWCKKAMLGGLASRRSASAARIL